nr:metal ABC transporter substrate-binding protein [uncultured Rhodopila sp.]
MKRRTLIASLGLASLLRPPAHAASAMPVVASFSILADMVRRVGGEAVAVTAFVGPDQDVHIYDPRPKDLRTLMAASLLVQNGLGLEGWMVRLTGSAGFKGRIVTAAEKVVPRTMAETPGVIATDPHAWQDPRNAVLYVQAIMQGLIAADTANAAFYRANADKYSARIAETDAWIMRTLEPIDPAHRRIITTHDAFGYYGARYGIEFLAAEGISTESEPSARAIAALVEQIRREKVRAVFIENMTGDRMARMLARETGAVLGGTVYSDALSEPDGPAPAYLDMQRYNTSLFAAAMQS